jgi:general secretion pathway protein D
MKAVTTPLCLMLLLATAPVSLAQVAITDAAVQEAVRREADRVTLRQKIVDARSAEQRRDIATAAKLYSEAWTLVQRVGTNVEAEAQAVIAGLTQTRMELARAAQRRGNYREAQTQIADVLRVNPANTVAIEFQQANERLLAAQQGSRPSDAVVDLLPQIRAERIATATLVQDGRLLYELGRLDEAERKLEQALAQDPGNSSAAYYLSLVHEQRNSHAITARNLRSKDRMVEIERAWEDPLQRDLLPQPNPHARTNLIYTSRGRQAIVSKLDRIRLDSIGWDGLPLSEVIRNLSDEARKRDLDRRGINFIINPNVEAQPQMFQQQAIDPTTGLPIMTGGPVEPVDVAGITVKIDPPLVDVRLADVLDAIIKVAERPLTFSIEDYAVVFSLKGEDVAPLHVRWFRVDPNTFYQGLESVGAFSFGDIDTSTGGGGGGRGGGGRGGGGGGQEDVLTVPRVMVAGGGGARGGGGQAGGGTGGAGLRFVTRTNHMEEVHSAVRNFFITMGVDLTPPKTIFFNDRQGTLVVKATLADLDMIEAAVQALNVAPPQVNVKAKFVEVTQVDNRAIGFDWYLGNIVMANSRMGIQGGTAPSFQGPAPGTYPPNPEGVFPNPPFFQSGSDQFLTAGLRNAANAPAVATLTGILTDPQFRVVLRALEQRDGVDLLNEGQVTTLSGRQAQIQVVDLRTIVTGVDLNQQTGGGAAGLTGIGGAGVVGSTVQFNTQVLPFGPVLDVIPYVSADGYTIQMSLIPTVTEFSGYDDPAGFVPQAQSVSGGGTGVGVPLTAQLPLPRFRLRQVTTSAIVWDGQTVVLGGLITEDIVRMKDKIPVLGDLPLVGRLFRSESASTSKRNLIIFVTPTIIDPAGNRLHSDVDLPFAQTAIPPQLPVVPAP